MRYKAAYLMNANQGIYDVIRTALRPVCETLTLTDGVTALEIMGDTDFVISGKVTAAMISAAAKLKLILAPGIGVDGIDLNAAAERNIPVVCTICGNVEEVAEHTLLLMLAVSRRLVELDAALRRGEWMMWDRRLETRNLAGRTLGIVGFGRIGQEIAKRAAAFRMSVTYSDPVRTREWNYTPLTELLANSDFVSLNVPLTAGTRNLMSCDRIAMMKPGSVLINTARGEVVDEPALIEALRNGQLSGAGIDVFATEPAAAGHPLFSMPNVVVTPHVGSGTRDGLEAKAAQYAENIRRCLAGEPLIDSVQAVAEVAAR